MKTIVLFTALWIPPVAAVSYDGLLEALLAVAAVIFGAFVDLHVSEKLKTNPNKFFNLNYTTKPNQC